MAEADRARFREGIGLFNEGRFWHAHEAWEAVWRRKPGEWEYFFKGLIQAAAAFHQLERGRYRGTAHHLDNACAKLAPFAPEYLGVDTGALLRALEICRAESRRLGPGGMDRFPRRRIPKIAVRGQV